MNDTHHNITHYILHTMKWHFDEIKIQTNHILLSNDAINCVVDLYKDINIEFLILHLWRREGYDCVSHFY